MDTTSQDLTDDSVIYVVGGFHYAQAKDITFAGDLILDDATQFKGAAKHIITLGDLHYNNFHINIPNCVISPNSAREKINALFEFRKCAADFAIQHVFGRFDINVLHYIEGNYQPNPSNYFSTLESGLISSAIEYSEKKIDQVTTSLSDISSWPFHEGKSAFESLQKAMPDSHINFLKSNQPFTQIGPYFFSYFHESGNNHECVKGSSLAIDRYVDVLESARGEFIKNASETTVEFWGDEFSHGMPFTPHKAGHSSNDNGIIIVVNSGFSGLGVVRMHKGEAHCFSIINPQSEEKFNYAKSAHARYGQEPLKDMNQEIRDYRGTRRIVVSGQINLG